MSKTALISGSSRGIGAAVAERLAKDGWNIVLNYVKNAEKALALAEKLSKITGVTVVKADVSVPLEAKKLFDEAKKRFGKVDLLVNNAGISEVKPFDTVSYEEWKRTFEVNVDGVFNLTQEVLPDMISRKSGKIVNISSMWGQVGASCEVAYSASKAAVIGFTKALAKELGPSGITVNCVCPGYIDTEMNSAHSPETVEAVKEETPLGRIGTPNDVAEAVRFLAGDAADFVTGQIIGINGGLVI